MLLNLTGKVGELVQANAPWQVRPLLIDSSTAQVGYIADVQDIEAILHCVRYSSEAVPLGEETSLPIMFGDAILGRLAHRPLSGRGEERLRLTVVCLIRTSSTDHSSKTWEK